MLTSVAPPADFSDWSRSTRALLTAHAAARAARHLHRNARDRADGDADTDVAAAADDDGDTDDDADTDSGIATRCGSGCAEPNTGRDREAVIAKASDPNDAEAVALVTGRRRRQRPVEGAGVETVVDRRAHIVVLRDPQTGAVVKRTAIDIVADRTTTITVSDR